MFFIDRYYLKILNITDQLNTKYDETTHLNRPDRPVITDKIQSYPTEGFLQNVIFRAVSTVKSSCAGDFLSQAGLCLW